MNYTKEIMSNEFTKHLIDIDSFHFVPHHFTGADHGLPHDHPYSFTSFVLKGGYVEEIYRITEYGTWSIETILRPPGTVHEVKAETIHRIIDLPKGEAWTICLPGEKVREPRFWQFNVTGIYSRAWNEKEFTPFNIK